MKKLILKKLHRLDNKGNTMFETIVAFFVLTIILAIIYQMIAFCGELRMKATDTGQVVDDFNQNIYKTSIDTTKIASEDRHSESAIEGPLFYLRLSDETNIVKNFKDSSGSISYTADDYRLRMNYMGAITYKSKDARIASEKLVTPTALKFYYYGTTP